MNRSWSYVNGEFRARGPRTKLYMKYTQHLIQKFREVRLNVSRGKKIVMRMLWLRWFLKNKGYCAVPSHWKVQEIMSIPEIQVMQVDDVLEQHG